MITKDMFNALFKPLLEVENMVDEEVARNVWLAMPFTKLNENKTQITVSNVPNPGRRRQQINNQENSSHKVNQHEQHQKQSVIGERDGRRYERSVKYNTKPSSNANSHTHSQQNQGRDQANNSTSQPTTYTYSKSSHRNQRQAHPKLPEKSRGYLLKEKHSKLKDLLDEVFEICSKDGSIKFTLTMFDFLKKIKRKLWSRRVFCVSNGIRLVGSGASWVVSNQEQREINDLDFSFYISEGGRFLEILEIEEDVLGEFIREQTGESLSRREIYDLFFLDSVKIDSNPSNGPKESWSLVTIGKKGAQTIDIKFVYKSKRSYVFSSDSFEVVLDPLLSNQTNQQDPNILVESIYGDYEEALNHLTHNVLCTINPEEIRRGIFRYSYELAKGKHPKTEQERANLEQVFVDALLSESDTTTNQFDDVLFKFLQKHTAMAHDFLKEFLGVLRRSKQGKIEESCNNNDDSINSSFEGDNRPPIVRFMEIIQKYLAQYNEQCR